MVVATEVLAITAGPCSANPTEGAGWCVNFAGSGGRALPAADPVQGQGVWITPIQAPYAYAPISAPNLCDGRAISRARSPPPPVAPQRWHPHDPSPPL